MAKTRRHRRHRRSRRSRTSRRRYSGGWWWGNNGNTESTFIQNYKEKNGVDSSPTGIYEFKTAFRNAFNRYPGQQDYINMYGYMPEVPSYSGEGYNY